MNEHTCSEVRPWANQGSRGVTYALPNFSHVKARAFRNALRGFPHQPPACAPNDVILPSNIRIADQARAFSFRDLNIDLRHSAPPGASQSTTPRHIHISLRKHTYQQHTRAHHAAQTPRRRPHHFCLSPTKHTLLQWKDKSNHQELTTTPAAWKESRQEERSSLRRGRQSHRCASRRRRRSRACDQAYHCRQSH
jgi:hypothetical protein